LGVRTSSAQITDHYQAAELVGKQVVAVLNFPPKHIAGVQSEILILGANDEQGVILLSPDKPIPNGARVY